MSGPPRFSVLLPTHRRADVLGFSIASVLSQSEGDFELLVVGDGIDDATRQVVASFPDPRIRLFDLPKGASFGYANRNLALREARGRLIAFAADDDLYFPDHLALMGELLDQSGAEWGHSRPAWVTRAGEVVPYAVNLREAEQLQRFLQSGNVLPAACVVHTRALLERAGYWPEGVPRAADWHLWRRMLAMTGNRFASLRVPTNLHFAASWRTAAHDPFEMQSLTELASRGGWWPAALRLAGFEGPEQAAFAARFLADPRHFSQELRNGCDDVVDRLAWTLTTRELRLFHGFLPEFRWRWLRWLSLIRPRPRLRARAAGLLRRWRGEVNHRDDGWSA